MSPRPTRQTEPMMITKTENAETITYTAVVDGVEVSELVIDAATRKVWSVETLAAYQRSGYARILWDAAQADGQCFHAVEHHRTAEGDAFAHAVGGDTIADHLDIIDECCICTGDDAE